MAIRADPLSILVTRPAGQADALCSALRTAGYRVCHQPLLELQGLEHLSPDARRHLQHLDSYQHVIFVSANAVRYGMDCIADYWPQLPVGLNWYAVGASTAARLADYGPEVISPEQDMTSEGLLALPQLAPVEGDAVLIVRGEGGRTRIQDVLLRRGARVDTLECYRRSCPALARGEIAALLEERQVDIALISSGEGLTNLLALLSQEERTKFKDIGLVVPSPRVAELAEQSGFSRVKTASNASDEAMLHALGAWEREPGEQ